MWHNNSYIEKQEKRGVHLYLLLEKEVMAESFLRKGKWKVAFLVDNLKISKISA